MPPDPKPSQRRIVDPKAVLRAKVKHPHCAACGTYGGDAHHVLSRARGGDDVEANIVVLCGSGASGDHGAFHGNPHVVDGVRRDAAWVKHRVGAHIAEWRPDVLAYLAEKLGQEQADRFLGPVPHHHRAR